MTNRLRPEHLQELRFLQRLGHAMIEFMAEHSTLGALGPELSGVLETTVSKQDLRGLRMLYRDLHEMSRGMSPQLVEELDHRLERIGSPDADALRTVDLDALQEIAGRGRIRNEREFRLVLSYLDVTTSAPLPLKLRQRLAHLAQEFGPVP